MVFNPMKIRASDKKMVNCPVKKTLCLVSDCYDCTHIDTASAYMNRVTCEAVILDEQGALKESVRYHMPMINPEDVE